ncbi:MAG: inner membrane CreD family protein [Lentisphaeria bacterium]|nr:inner membrane CreD family protein [Lentisphaeria bacterium]
MKIIAVVAALVIFQVPLYMVSKLAGKRKEQAQIVQNEIAKNWGGKQYIELTPAAAVENIAAQITPEIRYRGIYQAVVFSSDVKITREYKNLAQNTVGTIKLPELKSVAKASVLVNGKAVQVSENNSVLTFPLPAGDAKTEINISARGSDGIHFTPNASQSHISVSGKWDSPSFAGEVLPAKRSIEKDSFSGEWHFDRFNAATKSVGVNLTISAGTYQQVERCFTYATFFLIVFFFTLLTAEMITKVNVYILQYLVAAGAPVLFYLMALAFSEKIGFTAGYITSAAVIVVMVTMYAKMFLGKLVPALIMGTVFAASYLLNFILLRLEDFALLAGTIVLAVILGVLMFLTGKINRSEKPEGRQIHSC